VATAAPEDRDVGLALDAIRRRGLKKVRGT